MPEELILFINREHTISLEALAWAKRAAGEKGLNLKVYDEYDLENEKAKDLIVRYRLREAPTFIYKGRCYPGFMRRRIE